ncbi:MAG: hypothetical protein R2939_21825 [Kofleriaceae bacterium]
MISEQLGTVAEGPLATCLGMILVRPDFGPEDARLQVVRALGKMSGPEALAALADYVEATPAKPPRASRREAEQMVDARLGGGS